MKTDVRVSPGPAGRARATFAIAYLSMLWPSLPSLCLCSASSSSLCARDLIHFSIAVGDDKMVLPPTLSLHLLVPLPLPAEMTVEFWELEQNEEASFLMMIHACRVPLSNCCRDRVLNIQF